MNIEWNKYTWYSKWLSLIFFILVLPVLTFYIGTRYELAKSSLENNEIQDVALITNKPSKNVLLVASTTVDGTNLHIADEDVCKENSNYVVVAKKILRDAGSDILVKYKSDTNPHPSCDYSVSKDDFEIKNGTFKQSTGFYNRYDSQYFLALEGDYLILDNGTAPPPRNLIIISLKDQKVVGEYQYSYPIDIQNNTAKFWTPTDVKKVEDVCTKEEIDEGLNGTLGGTGVLARSLLDLSTMKLTDLREYRCQVYQ